MGMAQPPLLLVRGADAEREDLQSYRARNGYQGLSSARAMAPAAVCTAVEASELRGRGGAGFPVGRKWALAAASADLDSVVVANGGEHEPGSSKDHHLLECYPHTVIEGAAIAAHATGAGKVYLYLIEDMNEAVASLEAALAEARAASLLGDLDVEIFRAPSTYVAGEETAALAAIEGQPAKPRKKPPYPGESGVHGKPTTVNNVETLAHLPGILSHGAEWFRGFGVPGSRGTMIFTLDRRVNRPGLHELPFGTTLRNLIEDAGGGVVGGERILAILPALSSSFLRGDQLDISLDHDSMTAAGSGLGCGGLHLVLESENLLDRVLEIARFFQAEQCGQCPPCRMETSTLVAILQKIAAGAAGEHLAQAEKIAAFTRQKGFCSLIEMAAAPVLSAMRLFPESFGGSVES